ncbi:hypothetical protein GOODEAATRI_001884 [Goodea atripinnis]|uniref:Uncharacterized protein n=1 Tax=Goodea atripinnis TaxID=208336 RepID=A0ABV0MP15_9TELE
MCFALSNLAIIRFHLNTFSVRNIMHTYSLARKQCIWLEMLKYQYLAQCYLEFSFFITVSLGETVRTELLPSAVRACNDQFLMARVIVLVCCVAFGRGKAGSFTRTQRKEVPELLLKRKLPDLKLTTENNSYDIADDKYGQLKLFHSF